VNPWTFAHVADIQVGSPRSFRFAPAWNDNWRTARRQIVDLAPELLLVGGDLTRDGSLHRFELEAVKSDLDALPMPVHVIPGNMDTGNKHARVQGARDDRDDLALNITAEQVRQFADVFGPARWTFVHRGVRFTGFCDMLVNSGLPAEDDLWRWMERLSALPREDHHVWITHYPLFIDDPHEPNFDPTDPAEYPKWYFGIDEPGRGRLMDAFDATGADLVVSGHVHNRRTRTVGGVRFDSAPATCMAQFADHWGPDGAALGFTRYDVTDDGIDGTFIPLAEVSTRPGYGPGGHPLPQLRRYPSS